MQVGVALAVDFRLYQGIRNHLEMFTEVGILPEEQLVLAKSQKMQEQFRKAVAHFELEERSSAKRSSSTCFYLMLAWRQE